MRLLVSVRSAEEVAAALAGGADIIDAKEPARGSLGAVTSAVLSAIAGHTPAWVPLSVALGDCTDLDELRATMDAARPPDRPAPVYLKLGFAGTRSLGRITALLKDAVAAANPNGLVAVGYADHGAAGTLPPEDVLGAAVTAGARGVLVDTWRKDGRALLDHLSIERLTSLSLGARSAGLLFALAGSLDGAAIARLAGLADIVGVRGAACRGGRSGTVNAGCVAELRRRVGRAPAPLPAR
jgi:uncharacterized protein (UPF0264 family)